MRPSLRVPARRAMGTARQYLSCRRGTACPPALLLDVVPGDELGAGTLRHCSEALDGWMDGWIGDAR